MARRNRFTFLCNSDERNMIAQIAQRLHRSQSDAIRMVLRQAAHQLIEDTGAPAIEGNDPGKSAHSDAIRHIAAVNLAG